MATFIEKKRQMKKQKTTESVDKLQCDATNTTTPPSNWTVKDPT